jgi:hypothetical protein
MLAEAERVERSRPLRIIVGFKPTKHATCEPLGWRRADHSKAMPHDGTHRLATACRTPPASLSMIGARLRTRTSRLPLTKRAHRYLCVTGKNWWAAQESHDPNWSRVPRIARASLCLKGRSLLTELTREICACVYVSDGSSHIPDRTYQVQSAPSLVPMAGVAPAACALPMRCTSRCASTA